MKGDFTRTTFRPINHYSGVYLQQGRVQLDADWNEQVDIEAHRDRTTTGDLVGPSGVPWVGDSFRIEIEPTEDASDLIIRPGHIYVDGILCELDGAWVGVAPDAAAATKVGLPAGLLADGRPLVLDQWVELAVDLPIGGTSTLIARISAVDKPARTLTLTKALPTSWGAGSNLRLRRLLTYKTQPDLPNAPAPAGGWNIIYIDAWQRHVTALERPRLREEALGGPDSATRVQTLWQVRTTPVVTTPSGGAPVCGAFPSSWRPPGTASTARLRARTVAAPPATECLVPGNAGYRRLENQLYRVEIHDISAAGIITFKWSRDNASIATRGSNIDPNNIVTVADAGKDSVLRFEKGRLLELSDEPHALHGSSGQLLEITNVQGNEITVKSWPNGLDPISGPTFDSATVIARRWEGGGTVDPTKWHALEDGIEIQFTPQSGLAYRPGDYWLIPARTLTAINPATTTLHGGIDWPQDGGGAANEAAVFQSRHGTEHRYAVLALGSFATTWQAGLTDCRRRFPAATQLTSFYYISGDGQEAMPGDALPKPLQVGVANGQFPVNGARVRFSIIDPPSGGGVVDRGTLTVRDAVGIVIASGQTVVVRTAGGVATCSEWKPSAVIAQRSQQVEAVLLDDLDQSVHLPIRFTANLSAARYIRYEAGCPANAATVQEAVLSLCSLRQLFYIGGDGQQGAPNTLLIHDLQVGITNGDGLVRQADAVKFSVVGGGTLRAPDGSASTASITVDPDSAGVYRCRWQLGPGGEQQVEATLSAATNVHLPIRFAASFAAAEEPGIRVKVVTFISPPLEIELDGHYSPDLLSKGIRFICVPPDGGPALPLAPKTINRATCFLTAEVPLSAVSPSPPNLPSNPPNVGFVPTVAAATPFAAGTDIVWQPTAEAADYLRQIANMTAGTEAGALLVRLSLLGNFIWSADNPVYLDGDTFSEGPPGSPRLRIPTGDGRRGGRFEMWFWLEGRAVRPTLVFPTDVILVGLGGGLVRGRVRLAEASGTPVRIALASSRAEVVVPPEIVIPAGSSEAEIEVRVRAGSSPGPVTITARPREDGREGQPVTIDLRLERA